MSNQNGSNTRDRSAERPTTNDRHVHKSSDSPRERADRAYEIMQEMAIANQRLHDLGIISYPAPRKKLG